MIASLEQIDDIRPLTTDEIDTAAGGVIPVVLVVAGAAFGLFFTGTLTALAAQAK
ncbi:MAG: hypothetical protein AB7O57_03340 [Hyphomicrobiaceae bacterium]